MTAKTPDVPRTSRLRLFQGERSFCPAEHVFTCTQVVTITQEDVDAGILSGNVEITAVNPEGDNITTSSSSTVPLDGTPSVVLGRQANFERDILEGLLLVVQFCLPIIIFEARALTAIAKFTFPDSRNCVSVS